MIDATVSRSRVLSKLGGGGIAVVQEAEDAELGRRHRSTRPVPVRALAARRS